MIPAGATIGGYHTFDDFRMIPKSRLIVAPPAPKLKQFDIPGVDGNADFTDRLLRKMLYTTRKGTWNFIVISGLQYMQAYTNALSLFNGSVQTCVLDDEPTTTYKGRFHVSAWKSYEGYSDLSVDYDISEVEY